MGDTAKYLLIASGIAFIALSLLNYPQALKKAEARLGQNLPIVQPESPEVTKLVSIYVGTHLPKSIDYSTEETLTVSASKGYDRTISMPRVNLPKALPFMLSPLLVKLPEANITALVADLMDETDGVTRSLDVKEADVVDEKGFLMTVQMLVATIPKDKPESVSVTVRAQQFSGTFKPITKVVKEIVCTRKYFGLYETCEEKERTVEFSREITPEYLEKVRAYLSAKLLAALKRDA